MREHSFLRSTIPVAMISFGAGLVLSLFAPGLSAQCSADGGPDSFDCQLQQAAPLTGGNLSAASPAVLSLEQTAQQQFVRGDGSNEASAENSLGSGSNYTEAGSRAAGSGSGARNAHLAASQPLTEFQRFVAATTGHVLPIYGANLFAGKSTSFGPIDQAPAPENLLVGAGDELRIRIWGQINFSANLRVNREGEIYLPKAGSVHVAGLPYSEVAQHLRNALERIYRNFELSVDMGAIHSIQIYVAGEATRPGEYTVSALSTLVDAVFLSNGPSGAGSMRHVQLKRGTMLVTDFDPYALLVRGDKTGDVQLKPGDVLYIPPAGPEVALLGSVRESAIYELRANETIGDLLEVAGGRTPVASGGHISVERIEDHAQLRAFELTEDASGLQTLLADGDIVRVDSIVSSYREAVTLRGSVANPGRFRWHAGMRLSDLMPDKDSLVSRDYWWRRTQLGLPAPEFAPSISSSAALKDSSAEQVSRPISASPLGDSMASSPMGGQAALLRPAAQTNWDFAAIERLNTSTMHTSLIRFDLGKLVLGHEASQDLELQPGDIVTIFSQDEIHLPVERQTRYVRLEGEFERAGIYSVSPGETLRSLVERAGGLTAGAYLYGAEFTRKSTQEIEQERLNEYADRMEHQAARSSVSQGGGSAPGQVAAINRELIARLRQLRPTGRIVLNLRPQSTGGGELPEMLLEDGDRLLIPPRPATIQVVGSVFNQNAFLFRNGSLARDYLQMAGGPSRDADRGQIFILRADGSVTGHGAGRSPFSSGIEESRLFPGDTVVVPEKNVRPGAMREFLTWTQLFSQLALGSAAVNVLR